MDVLLLGDQTSLSYDFLNESLQRVQNNPITGAFLNGAAHALRQDIAHISQANRKPIPKFTTIQELVPRYFKGPQGHPAIEGSLLCISQFLHFFGHYECNSRAYPQAGTQIVGLCVGSLTAAAIASSRSLSDLLPLAVETVGIAFRVGLQALDAACHLNSHHGEKESWSYVFHGMDRVFVDGALAEFNREADIPKPSRPYMSAVGPNTITISGPPSVLKRLVRTSSAFKKESRLALPLHAPYHTPELFEHTIFREVVLGNRPSTVKLINRYRPQLPLLSTSTGNELECETTLDLLTQIVHDILKKTLRWDLVVGGCVSKAAILDGAKVNLLAFGPVKAVGNLVSAFQAKVDAQIMLQDATSWLSSESTWFSKPSGGFKDSKIAIVGMAGRFPDGADHEKFWDVIEKGLDVHKEIPNERFDSKSHVDPNGKVLNTSHTPYGCFIDNPGHFDPRFFNMSPREAAQTDPMQRLALVTAYEALEMAGYVPNRTASTTLDRVGTFYGQTSDDYRETNASQAVDTYFITGGIRAFGPGRINYHFKFSGPSYNVDTACSSSLAAVQLACTALWSGDCDTAVAGGLSVLTSPDLFAGLSRGQFLSKTGSCKTFDNAADGYCRGDSIGTVILKRLDDAVSDKDNVLGVILGAATNHSADAISITHPHAQTQEHLYRKVLAQAGVNPLDVHVAEMHGTGTQAGDGAEMESISNVLAPEVGGRDTLNPLYVGSVKANVGHGEAASGVTALIKSLLMFQKSTIPPHAGIKGLINQTFPDLDKRNIRIATKKTPFTARNKERRRLLVNNFSAAGGNTALLLEDFERPDESCADIRAAYPVVISAKSRNSLAKNVENMVVHLDKNPHTSLPNLSYTTTARRMQHDLRVAAVGTSLKQVKDQLQSNLDHIPTYATPKLSKVAFAFTGQGSYYAALGQDLYDTSRSFRDQINHYNSFSLSHGFPSILQGRDATLGIGNASSPVEVQLLLVCVQMALCNLWASWGITPEVVIGHSLGEYPALYAAGVLSSSDVIFLVGHRARLLEETCGSGTHGMLAVRASASLIQKLLVESHCNLEIACVNGPEDVVLSGLCSEIEVAESALVGYGHRLKRLEAVPFAFHSSQVDPILGFLEEFGNSVNFNAPNIPIISPVLGVAVDTANVVNPAYLSKHARETVNFDSALREAQNRGLVSETTGWLEIGPHPVCLGMIKNVLEPGISVASMRRNENAWTTLASSIKELYVHGLNLDWNEYHRDFNDGHHLLNLPTYAFEEKNYWLEYKNNWTLTKGAVETNIREDTVEKFSTSTLQRIVSEEFHDDKASVVFESDFSQSSLHAAVTGHLVNDSGLCPSSIYADMAMTAAKYIHQQLLPSSPEPGMNVRGMEVSKPVIVSVSNTTEPQLIQITATADLSTNRVDIEYDTVDVLNRSRISNAHCSVEYGDAAEWLSNWARSAYLIESRVLSLESETVGGNVQRILRGMAYKLFSALVQYSQPYRGMEEVLLLSSQREAVAKVKFQANEELGNFYFSPYWIDSLAHLSGFVLNANDAVDSKSRVFISHGWENMRFVPGRFSTDKTYRTYVKMQPEAGTTIMAGDVYVFELDTVVGLIEGLKFQQVPRTVLDHLLPPANRATISKKSAASTAPAVPPGMKKMADVQSEATPSLKRSQLTSVTSRIGEIIAAEVGVSAEELSEQSNFSEIGIDSLLSLTIIGRLREELPDLQLSSTLFQDHATYGALKNHLQEHNATATPIFRPSSAGLVQTLIAGQSPISTPGLTPSTGKGSLSEVESSESHSEPDTADTVKIIIAEEMGLTSEEVSVETSLASLGMDSLMSLTILGALREKTGLDLPQAFLANDPSIKDLEAKLKPLPVSAAIDSCSEVLRNSVAPYYPPATSVLLQGSVNNTSSNLFLFPDGSGSATSYTALPVLSSSSAVYGLNSPFLKSPRDYTCGITVVAQIYITEIKRRQPKGPYLLGGWSVGGIIAYEAAYQLIQSGETVEQLLLVDSPCPLLLPPLPVSLVRFFDSLGLFGQGQSPPWLLEHFDSSVANLHRYRPRPVEAMRSPRTFALWARAGVCSDPSIPKPGLCEEESKSKSWILDDRVDFGPNCWDELVGRENISGVGMPGNHFTIMQEPNVARLGQQMDYALSQGSSRLS